MAIVGVHTRVQWRNRFGQYTSEIEDGAEGAQIELSEMGAALARAFAPRFRGVLAGSIHSTGDGFETGALPHALPQEKGAAPHLIGRDAKVLAGDDFGPVRGPVLHPGNRAQHYMKNALKVVGQRMMSIVRKHMP